MIVPLTLVFFFSLASSASFSQAKYKSAVNTQEGTNKSAIVSQKKVDQLDDDTRKMLGSYQITVQETKNLKVYNDQLEKIIMSQVTEMKSMQEKTLSIVDTQKGIIPLMLKMVDSLEQFIALDSPFLLEERQQRLSSLKKTLDRADVATSEKYRRILEAFQVENEYGRTIEAYRGSLAPTEGQSKTVDFLRVGRVILIYQSLDANQSGVWDKNTKSWKALPSKYRKAINQGLRIARKQAAPNLLRLPIPAPEVKS